MEEVANSPFWFTNIYNAQNHISPDHYDILNHLHNLPATHHKTALLK